MGAYENVGARGDRASDLHADEAFVHEMRRRRALLELSQGELAARASALGESLYQQTIAKIESGQRPLKLSEADAIAHALGSNVQEMLNSAYGEPHTRFSDSRNTEELREAVDAALAELQAAQMQEAATSARAATSLETARAVNAAMREDQQALLAARAKVSTLQDRYQRYVTQLAAWREVEERKRQGQQGKHGSALIPEEEQKEDSEGGDST
ncbi:helix-turn-helix domain-containing protein [Streptomyces reticuliscabiei]|uniref:helix-turn-helix domain-containing protein n=1 Tax=Streptomyces reticuliscabiei TaxID=146821 RepID=UPI000D19DBA0|nr:helix-turn-helix transcriptional regulator [Streptomyces reticuliscabiei]